MLQLPTLLTSADARTVADDSGSGPWRRGQQAPKKSLQFFQRQVQGEHLLLQATGRSLSQFLFAHACPGRAPAIAGIRTQPQGYG